MIYLWDYTSFVVRMWCLLANWYVLVLLNTYIIYYVVCSVVAMALSFNILYLFVQDLSKDDLPPHMQRVTRKEIEKVCEMLLSVK